MSGHISAVALGQCDGRLPGGGLERRDANGRGEDCEDNKELKENGVG
jgi:hypothetical protein